MKFGIFGKVVKEKDVPLIKKLLEAMLDNQIDVYLYRPFYEQLREFIDDKKKWEVFDEKDTQIDLDLLLTIGGDGTLLHSISFTQQGKIPVMGINTGRLGFLTSINREQISKAFDAFRYKEYYLEPRSLIVLKSKDGLFGDWNYALNECTVIKSDSTSMITVHVYIDDQFLNSYWGDGLIISTPTGSTGYSLSCGGPIIAPNSKNFVLTPIAPHNLSIRSIVITDDKVLTLKVQGRSDHFLCTMDARSLPVSFNKELTLHRAPFALKMLRLKDYNFLRTIREKLMWGMDRRNTI